MPNKDTIDQERRRLLSSAIRILGCVGAACAVVPFVSSLKPNQQTLAANQPIDIDLSDLKPGQQITVHWQGKPIWILRRTQTMLTQLAQHNPELRDPLSLVPQQPAYAQNAWRSLHPEYLVLIGICTHLGCIPNYRSQDVAHDSQPGGYDCPCHGSRFDLSGRVYRNMPAPINLAVPLYRFVDDHTLRIGESG